MQTYNFGEKRGFRPLRATPAGSGTLDQQGNFQWQAVQELPKRVSGQWTAIVPARNESRTLAAILSELKKLELSEVIVVVNGSTDDTRGVADRFECRVIEVEAALGHDVGRALGAAKATPGDGFLFVDADVMVLASELAPFMLAVERGMDVALNDISRLTLLNPQHPVNIAKAHLNLVLNRPDLGYSSLTGIPHALSRKALEVIGVESLAIPPLAHAKAILNGLKVGLAGPVDVVGRNRIHGKDAPVSSQQLEQLILGDHLEALAYLVNNRGLRGGFTDGNRARHQVLGITPGEPMKVGAPPRVALPRGLSDKAKSSGTDRRPK